MMMKQKNKSARSKKLGLNAKLLSIVMPVIIVVMAAIISIIFAITSNIVFSKSEENLRLSTQSVTNSVSAWMNDVLASLETQRDALEYFSMDENAELDYIKHTANRHDAYPAGIYIATTQGDLKHASFIPDASYNVFEKPWYQDGLKSEAFILGSVYFDEDSKSYVVGASGVLKAKNGAVRGVAAADIYLNAISQIVSEIQLGKTGGVFLVDRQTNTVIGHKDPALVGAALDEQSDPLYAFVLKTLSSGETGLQTYAAANSEETYLDFENVPDSQWVAIAYEPRQEVMADLNALISMILVIAVVSVAVLLLLIIFLMRFMIIRPVYKIDTAARHIAEGALNEKIDYHSTDELGQLAANFNKTADRLRDYIGYIEEISNVLEEIANGNLNFSLTYEYTGEFSRIKTALQHISTSLSNTLGQIDQSAQEVSSGAGQVSDGAQALSQGAAQQAASIEELASAISELSDHVKANAQQAVHANEQADVVGREAMDSNRRMQELLGAMNEINAASGEIEKIIKTIEDIAFQTNILALNAAVEAARAGEAGKGFAVVADEVRNLATKSQEASKNTSALIENSLNATQNGTKIAGETANALAFVLNSVEKVTDSVKNISKASEEQAQSIEQINTGVEQISAVVQTNSATAQQSAAASQELSAQASLMNKLVHQFQLNTQGAGTFPPASSEEKREAEAHFSASNP